MAGEVSHIISYGQSLSLGALSCPVVSNTDSAVDLMFSGGLRPQEGDNDYSCLKAHAEAEQTNANVAMGETHCTGVTEMIRSLLRSENGKGASGHGLCFLSSACGTNGSSIADLAGKYYGKLIAHITNGNGLVRSCGKSYRVQAVLWSQGETDSWGCMSRSAYLSAMRALFDQIDATYASITGDTMKPRFIAQQMASHRYRGAKPYVAHAFVDAARMYTDVILAGPTYWVPHAADGVHLSALGSKLMGALMGIVYKKTIIDGDTWLPLMPIETVRRGNTARVRFHVPRGPLVFDTVSLAAQTNYGFTLADAEGNDLPISSVTIEAGDTVKIIAASSVPVGAVVRYGWGNGNIRPALGNLRDSQGDGITIEIRGIVYPLHDWSVLFEEELI
ncbi:MAG: hypothetical protein AABZ39_19035 [Spirochaetota bacterium]